MEGEHTFVPELEYTFVLVNVAVPEIQSPPPCQPREQGQSSIRAMEEMRQNAQNDKKNESAHSSGLRAHKAHNQLSGAMEGLCCSRLKVQAHSPSATPNS